MLLYFRRKGALELLADVLSVYHNKHESQPCDYLSLFFLFFLFYKLSALSLPHHSPLLGLMKDGFDPSFPGIKV